MNGSRPVRYLVTGGAGFIGSHVVDALVRAGDDVLVLDDLSTGSRQNLAASAARVDLVVGDVRDLGMMRHTMDGIEVVFHQAGLNSVMRSFADPFTTLDVNVRGLQNVLVAARDAGVRRVVSASSSSVYGNGEGGPVRRESMAVDPRSPYAAQKVAGELLCRVATHAWGLETVSLRYFNVFGPRQDASSEYAAAVPSIVRSLLLGRRPSIDGDGTQTRDFTYVDNIVRANLLARTGPASGRAINVGCGESVSVDRLFREASALCGSHADPEYRPSRRADIRHARADISLAQSLLGYEPTVEFSAGLALTVEASRQELAPLPSPADAGGESASAASAVA